DEQNALTAAAKLHDDTRAEAAEWLRQRDAETAQWSHRLAELQAQRDERLTTFPKLLLRQSSDHIADRARIEMPEDEAQGRALVERELERGVVALRRLRSL